MVADYRFSTQQVEASSMNISSNSLNSNRDLGLILTGTGVAQSVATTIEFTFAAHYAGATSAQVAVPASSPAGDSVTTAEGPPAATGSPRGRPHRHATTGAGQGICRLF